MCVSVSSTSWGSNCFCPDAFSPPVLVQTPAAKGLPQRVQQLYPLIFLLLVFLGHTEVVKFLIEACKVNPFVKDRWGNIPLDDAVQFNHLEVVKLLQDYQDSYVLSETQAEAEAEALSKENLESMV